MDFFFTDLNATVSSLFPHEVKLCSHICKTTIDNTTTHDFCAVNIQQYELITLPI